LTQEQALHNNLPSSNGGVKMRKRHLKWLWILVIFFAGCAAVPVQKTDLSKIKFGCSMEEVKKTISPAVPEIKKIVTPLQAVYTFQLVHLTKGGKASQEKGDEASQKKLMEVIGSLCDLYKNEEPGRTLLLYNINEEPCWFMFDKKGKLISSGEGDEEVALCFWRGELFNTFRLFNILTYKQAEERKAEEFKRAMKVMKNDQFARYWDEYWAYRIMLADQLDKKEITEKEFDYLTTQKQNEMYNEAMRNIRDKYRADNQSGLTPSQALMMGLFLFRPHYAPYRPPYIGYGPAGLPIYNPSPY